MRSELVDQLRQHLKVGVICNSEAADKTGQLVSEAWYMGVAKGYQQALDLLTMFEARDQEQEGEI